MVLISPEDVTINGITLSAQFGSRNGYFIVNEVEGRHIPQRDLQLIQALGQDGAHYLGSTLETRPLRIHYTLKGESFADLQQRIEMLNGILLREKLLEIKFADEPNRLYYGVVEGGQVKEEKSGIQKGIIEIIRPDPYKYGNQITQDFSQGSTTVYNNGTYPTYPKFTFTASRGLSHLDIYTESAYMRIGQPADVGTTPVDTQERVLFDAAETMVGWTASSFTEGGTIAGAISSNGFSFRPSSFGTGSAWHGPAMQRSIPEAPLTDFMVEARIMFSNPTSDSMGRLVIELLDDKGAVMGRMNMNKRSVGPQGNEGVIRAGNLQNGHKIIESKGDTNKEWKDFDGILRISRTGNVWQAYIAKINYTTGQHHSRATGTFRDAAGTHTNPLAQLRIAFGVYGTTTAAPMFIQDLKVYRINQPQGAVTSESSETEGTATSSISEFSEIVVRAGDVIEIDNAIDLITINGEPRIDLKDFGASFFALKSGPNTLSVEPSDVEGFITFRERYL